MSKYFTALLMIAPLFGEIKEVSAQEAAQLLKAKKPPLVIDIRTAQEFAKGHLKNAQLIDYRKKFEAEISKLNRDQRYLFHCQSGGRSTQSLAVWKKLGFKKVYHLKSGYLGWQKAKLPTVTTKNK